MPEATTYRKTQGDFVVLLNQRAFPVVFAAVALIYYAWTWSHELADFGGDNAIYLLMAQHLSPFADQSDVAAFFYTRSPFPPLYPFILGLFDGGHSVLTAHIVTTTFFLLFLLVFYFWQLALGISRIQASLIVLLFTMLPGTYIIALSVLSENAYLLFCLLALLAIARGEETGNTTWHVIASVGVAASCLTRSAGIALLVAYALYLFLRRPARWPLFIVIAAVPFVWWNFLNLQSGENYFSSFAGYYGTNLLEAAVDVTKDMSRALHHGWLQNLTSSNRLGILAIELFGIVAISGALYRIYLRKLDGLYVGLYLAMIVLWPHPPHAERFTYVLVPILIVQGWLLLRHVRQAGTFRISEKPVFILFFLSIFLAALPTLWLVANRFLEPLPAELAGYSRSLAWYDPQDKVGAMREIMLRKSLVTGMRNIGVAVPPDECIYSVRPSILSFYSQRISLPYPQDFSDDETFRHSLNESKCRFFYMTYITTPSYRTPFYPASRMGGALTVLQMTRLDEDNTGSPVIAVLAEQKPPRVSHMTTGVVAFLHGQRGRVYPE
jgi:hypothetical protein